MCDDSARLVALVVHLPAGQSGCCAVFPNRKTTHLAITRSPGALEPIRRPIIQCDTVIRRLGIWIRYRLICASWRLLLLLRMRLRWVSLLRGWWWWLLR